MQQVLRIGNRRIINPPNILRFLVAIGFIILRFRLLGGAQAREPICNAFSGLTSTEKITNHYSNNEQKQ